MKMNIVKVKLSELKLDPNNARKHSPQNILAIKQSLQENPQYRPFVVQKGTNKICVGNGMYIAMQELGIKEGWVEYRDLDDKQFARLSVTDNRTAELAEWDEDILQQIISNYGDDIAIPGFGDDVSFNLDDDKEITEDEVPEITEEVVSVLGDVWKLGRHRLMCGDATDKATVEKLMNGVKADMILSDPPYGMKLDTDYSSMTSERSFHKGKTHNKVIGDNEDFKPELITTFFENFNCSEVFLFGADYFAELLPNKNEGSWLVWDKRKESQADGFGSEFELIWSKRKHKRRVLRHDWFGFFSSENAKDAQNRVHPTQKPVTLLADIINQWGGGVQSIVDLYGGSGSTLIACEQLNRTCYMMELDPKYVDVIIKRWQNLTGGQAINETTKQTFNKVASLRR
jgi:DNA modification methylase